jgi:hypothetical protein
MQSIEHTLRALDRLAQEETDQIEREEKALADYQQQLNRPFEQEGKLRELLARQAQLNAALDLDKGERQIAEDAQDPKSTDLNPDRNNATATTEGYHAANLNASRDVRERA